MAKTFKEYLEKLVSFPTITGDFSAAQSLLQWLKKEVADLPLFWQNFCFQGFPAVVLTTQKTKSPRLWLAAHLDVVPAPAALFSLRQEGDKLKGRGVSDMKFAAACYLKLLFALEKNLPQYDLGLIFTFDEEKGGFNGTKKVLEQGYKGDFCFLPDGGENWQIEEEAKGVCQFVFFSQGKAAHSSRPWKGRNAVVQLEKFLFALEKEFFQLAKKESKDFFTTFNLSYLRGGDVLNSVPATAEAGIDIRFTSFYTEKDIQDKIFSVLKNYPFIKIKKQIFGEGYLLDKENKNAQIFFRILKKQGKPLKFIRVTSSSDARFFQKKGIPTLLTRPKGGGIHQEDEWISLKSAEEFYQILKEFAERVAKIK